MEFISLSNVLVGIAKCIDLPPLNMFNVSELGAISPEAADKFWNGANGDIGERSLVERIQWARKMGFAALRLNKALHDSPHPIQWLELDKAKGFAVRRDFIKQEGIDLLIHATKWGKREVKNCFTHFQNSMTQGDDALATPISRGSDDWITPKGKEHRFLMEMGFDLSEVTSLLDDNEIAHNLNVQTDTRIQDETKSPSLPYEYSREVCNLFDPLNRKGIEKFFSIPDFNWNEAFERASRNGLKSARAARNEYNPAIVASWLVKQGKLSPEQAKRKLKKNLPTRSKDYGHLLTDDLPD